MPKSGLNTSGLFQQHKLCSDPAEHFLRHKAQLIDLRFDAQHGLKANWEKKISPQPVVSSKMNPLSKSDSSLTGLKNASLNAGKNLLEQSLPGLGKHITKNIKIVESVFDIGQRTTAALNQNEKISGTEASICSGVGTATKVLTTTAGTAAIYTVASSMIAESGGLALLPAAAVAKGGHDYIADVAPKVGDAAQGVCHKGFDITRRLQDALKTTTLLTSVPESPSLRP